MSGVGLEVLLESLIPEIAYSGEKGVSITELLKIVRKYHLSLGGQNASTQEDAAQGLQQPTDDSDLEKSLTAAEMSSARWAWDWLRSRPQILINGNKRWNRLELSEALALPETDSIDPAIVSAAGATKETEKGKGKKTKKTLTTRPRIHPSQDLVWQTLTRHGVDYKRVPALEWACLQGIASARAEGILQSDLRRLVDQDKRSLPKRTDSLARKGYVAKRTVVVQKMKTSRLWLIDFAPPLVEEDKCGLDLTPETLSKDLEPVPWHKRWSENNIDMDALGRTVVGVVKAFHVIRYADLRLKMGVSGKRWQMKTLAKNCQRLVDVGVLKYTAASFAESRKVFKDCLKFVREPTAEEWDKFLATGKKTSLYSDPTRHREPKPHALALYGKSGEDGQGTGAARSKLKRIFSGWIPEKPLAQTVFEVIRRAGPEGASNPQVSVATVGYQHRRYLSSYLTKVADTQQPQHLNKFQVVSKLVRTGKTSAYMFSAPRATGQAALPQIPEQGPSDSARADSYGFGAPRPKAFSAGQDFSLSDMSMVARKSKPSNKRKLLPRVKPQHLAAAEAARRAASEQAAATTDQGDQPAELGENRGSKRTFDEITSNAERAGDVAQELAPSSTSPTIKEPPRVPTDEDLIMNVRYNGLAGKLQVHRADRHVTFLRSGRGLKKPFVIPVDDNLDEPAIRDVPGSEEKSLVLATGEKDGKPAWTSVFIFDDDGQENAVWIQQEIIKMKSPDYKEPSPEEAAGVSEEITVGPAQTGAARGRGRGRGGSRATGRGKGKKGRNLPAGAKPYVCALCGNAWKNDIGLKYHLEKAQVPCNPNFDPTILLERARKRRKPSPVAPSVVNSEAGDDGALGRTRKQRGGRKGEKKTPRFQLNVRNAMRSVQDPAQKFRGISVTDNDNVEDTDNWVSERPKGIFKSATSVPAVGPGLGPEAPSGTGNNHQPVAARPFSNAEFRPSAPMGMASYHRPVPGVEHDAPQSVPATVDQGVSGMVAGHQQLEPLLQSLPTAPTTPARSRASEDAPAASDKPSYRNALDDFTLRPTNETPRFNRHADISPSRAVGQEEPRQSDYPDLAPRQMEQTKVGEFEAETAMSQNGQRISRPFVRSSNYERMASEAKRRTAQAFDIITYLLDNNLGVFPGDKALFYALTNVFLKEFPKQMPPTWKNFTGAVKAVESRKLAAVHTHMLKTERGRLQTCTLLIRTGVDPNGIIATKMKQKMRETYPGIFIPPAFSPTQDELVLLQELDKKVVDTKPNANGQKFRSRRKIEEIETFNAPYYKNTAPVAAPKRDPLWIRETERLFDDGFESRKRSVDDDTLTGPLHKRARTGFPDDEYGDIPVDPEIMGDPMSPSQHGQRDGPSVLEAIKAYSLLPAKLGPRSRRRPSYSYKPLAKLPRELGRVKNPGLGSLPDFFFGKNANTTAIQFVSPEVLILDPNTNLDEDSDGDEEGQGQNQGVSRGSSEDSLGKPEVEEGTESMEATIEQAKTFEFVWPAVLEPSSKGSWPDHTPKYFEHHEGSFTVNGWIPSQTWLLTQNIPSSAEEMADKQRAKKIKLRDWVDREYARFCSVVNQCAAWEQSRPGTAVMSGSSVVPDYYFINVSSPESRANSRAASLRWSDETQYDLETLPYDELEDDDYGDVIYVEDGPERVGEDGEPSLKKRRGVQKPVAGQAKRTKGGRPPKLKLAPIKTMREHTSYPKTADDLLRQDDNDDLDWSSENVRLAAFIVVTTLLGGVDKVVDWGLMLRLMPNQTISQLRHYWCALKKDRLSTIVSLTDKFRRAFLKAYEKNEVPPIDFNNVLAYDWKFIIKWTTKLDMAERLTLPSTRKALNKTVTVTKFKHGNRPWREAFYHPQRSIFNKFQDATSESLAYSVDNISDPKPSSEMIVAMSWTRSLCVTPVEAYTADAVLHKRNSLFPQRTKTEITELMIEGVDQLQRQAVISKSSSKWSNGRRWRFNTRVLDAIEKAAQQEKFSKAVQFKKELDQAFRAGEKKRVTYITNDGMVMALINMQASGRVRVETTGQPHVPMGHEPGNYETRKYTKKYMHFRLDIVPTETYLFDDATNNNGEEEDTALSDLRNLIKHTAPPTIGPGGAVPVWCDVFGKVDAERWLKYLSAVLITLASRGSMRAAELAETLKPVIMEFEAELIMQWAGRLGLLRAQFEGAAPAVMEWWWIVVGVQREGLVEAARAEAAARAVRQRKALPSGRPSGVAAAGRGGEGGGKGVEGVNRGVEGVNRGVEGVNRGVEGVEVHG